MNRTACIVLFLVMLALALSGCSESVRPKDIAMGEALCAEYKGMANLRTSSSLYYSTVEVICTDGSTLQRTYSRKEPQ